MTAILGIRVPSKGLNPKHLRVEFGEPGIILAADTRITVKDIPQQEDGLKVGELSPTVIAGFSGDVRIVDQALETATKIIQRKNAEAPGDVASIVETALRKAYQQARGIRSVYAATVFLGVWCSTPRLYRLESPDFTPRLRDGPVYAGSGGEELRQKFEV